MITECQRQYFADRGLIRIDKLIPEATIAPVRDLVLRVLERDGVWRNGSWCGDAPADWALGTRLLRKMKQSTKQSPASQELETAGLLEAVRGLAGGQPIHAMTDRPQVLLTPPNATAWTVPHKIWHLDVPRLGSIGLPGVQMFSFLNTVAPGGGGTLLVAGSHRLLNDDGRSRSKDVKKRLKRESYFRELMKPSGEDRSHFLEESGYVGDVEVRVVELTGKPGDVYLVDMRTLHTLAPNTLSVPRLMVTQRYFFRSVIDELSVQDQIPERTDA